MAKRFEITAEAAQDWKGFVADFVVAMTATKANREMVNGYQVKRSSAGYAIHMSGTVATVYPPMSAGLLYSQMERMPLVYFARQADDIRGELLSR